MFKNCLQENFWVHNLVKKFLNFTEQEMSCLQIWVSVSKVLGKGASPSNGPGLGTYSFAVATFLHKLWLNSGQKPPGPDQRQSCAFVQQPLQWEFVQHQSVGLHGLRHYYLLAFLGIWSAKVDDDSFPNAGTSSVQCRENLTCGE